jgi:hypothetical protein
MKVRSVKQMMVAAALTVVTAIAGMAGQAQAFSFTDGDLVLAIFGNNTEALYNLGKASDRLASGATFSLNVLPGLQAAGVGTNPVRFTVYGHDQLDANLPVWASTKVNPSTINPNSLQLTNQFGFSIGQSTLPAFSGDTIAKSDTRSFSSNLDPSGDGSMAGSWPAAMFGAPTDVLNILKADISTNTFTQVGRVMLGSDGLLTLGNPGPGGSPVPLPAGVVLFGSGLIGLIGIARRSFNRMAA